jgi:hypothetical protein
MIRSTDAASGKSDSGKSDSDPNYLPLMFGRKSDSDPNYL